MSSSTLWEDEDLDGPQPLRARWDPVPPPTNKPPRGRRSVRRRSRIGWFVHHYGWRAYAIPILAALTVFAIVNLVTSSTGSGGDEASGGGAPSGSGAAITVTKTESVPTTITNESEPQEGVGIASGDSPDSPGATAPKQAPATALTLAKIAEDVPKKPDANPDDAFAGVVMGMLPPGEDFAKTGAGTFHIVPGTSEELGSGSKHVTFTIEVEDGIQTAADDDAFATDVVRVLSDSRSWIGGGDVTLQRIDSGEPDFRITLTSEMTIRKADYCGWDIQLEASCYNYLPGRVLINNARWTRGSYVYGEDLASYRVYAVNHEVGHALGQHHEPCAEQGGVAPVMMQQSWSTSDDDLAKLNPGGPVKADGKVCRANPFPYPDGA